MIRVWRRIRQPLAVVAVFLLLYGAVTALAVWDARKTAEQTHPAVHLSQKGEFVPDPVTPQSMSGTVVYVTEHGTKYHRYADCSALKNSSVCGETWENAVLDGKEECELCRRRAEK